MAGLHELKGERLIKKTKLNTDHCTLLPINNLYADLSHHEFGEKLDNITQKQMDSMFYIMKAKKD